MRRIVWFFIATGLAACGTVHRLQQPTSLDHGLLITRVETHGAILTRLYSEADSARIIALDSAGVPVSDGAITSTLAVDGYVVFLDLLAGSYVLRSASFPARGVRYQVLVPKMGESRRAVTLRPGAAAYLGDHRLSSALPASGVALRRAGRIIGHWLTPFLKRPLLPRDTDGLDFKAGPAQETQALLTVRSTLAGTQWRGVVDARLRELSAAEAPKTEGVLRSRVMPLHEESLLSWRDTLKWGEPRRAAAGIAWRRPGGQAQIAVFFTSAAAGGFAGWDAAVSELRRTASTSIEDRGGVYEVRVATRVGLASRTTKHLYPEGMLVGSESAVVLTETILVPDGSGLYTVRLRAPRGEFGEVLGAYREFLLQLVLGPPKHNVEKPEPVIFLPEGPP